MGAPCCQWAVRRERETLTNGDMTCSPGRKLKQTINGPRTLQHSTASLLLLLNLHLLLFSPLSVSLSLSLSLFLSFPSLILSFTLPQCYHSRLGWPSHEGLCTEVTCSSASTEERLSASPPPFLPPIQSLSIPPPSFSSALLVSTCPEDLQD